MKQTIKTIACVAILALSFCACKKDKKEEPAPVVTPPPPANEEEIITTMRLSVFDGTTTVKYQFKDADGDGGNPGLYGNLSNAAAQSDSVINLLANNIYTVGILLLNETKTPADTISKEVFDEGKDHMFFFNQLNPTGTPYSVSLSASMTNIVYLDLDVNNRGIGLLTKWTTPSMPFAKSLLKVTLKHQPNVKNGTYAPGDTDIEIPFKLKIN